jgi:hypothetical protein
MIAYQTPKGAKAIDWEAEAEKLQAEVSRLRMELRWIADTPMQWTKPQNDVYWANVAMAMALKASNALGDDILKAATP